MIVKRSLLAALLSTIPLLALADIKGSDDPAVRKTAQYVAYDLALYHLKNMPINEDVATNAANMFLESLDPTRSFFLQSDIDAFAAKAPGLGARINKGDTSFANEVYDVLMQRIADRVKYVDELLDKGFDTSKKETFEWDRKDAPWPASQAEWNELWRKRIKNEYVTRLVSQHIYDEKATNTLPAATNQTAGAETTTNSVADAAAKEEESGIGDGDWDLSPVDFIRKSYRQLESTMKSFDEEMLLQRYLTAFTQTYDPHSEYMSPSTAEDFDINMKLSLVGIGAILRSDEGAARITQIIPGGPADRDGRLQAGDRIVAVGEGDKEPVSIMNLPLYKAVRLIRGEKDTKVVLTVIPASDRTGSRTKKIALVRDEVKLEEQAAKSEVREVTLADGSVHRLGILVLPDFYADFKATNENDKDARRASTDVKREINKLAAQGIEGMVLDLRNNGGGSLVEAIETAGLFITSGPVVQVKDRGGVQVLPDADPSVDYSGPMIVLVNRLSASASEILAAALQDYGRALVVGDRQTHGKGTVQTLMPLGNSKYGSLKLTTASFYRIDGGSTQLKGVTPDIVIPDYLDVMDLGENSLEHALPWDKIRPAMFRANDSLAKILPRLEERSKERLANNPEFQTFMERRERLGERYKTKTVSLSLDDRMAEAKAEKEMDDLQNKILYNETAKDKPRDMTLDETLNILADMITLQGSPEASQSPAAVVSAAPTAK